MAAKAILLLCAQALVIQATFSHCMRPVIDATRFGAPYGLGRGRGYDGLASPFGIGRFGYDNLALGCGVPAMEITPTSGGGLVVSSASAIPPVGVSLTSENVYEGILSAVGELPFVGTVGVDGVVPSAGAGAVNYGCGNGATVMASDILGPTIASPAIDAFGPTALGAAPFGPAASLASPGLGYPGWAGKRCGCGL